jgi:hypothetical protein
MALAAAQWLSEKAPDSYRSADERIDEKAQIPACPVGGRGAGRSRCVYRRRR